MTAALLVAALAVLCLPASTARNRLQRTERPRTRVTSVSATVAVTGGVCVVAVFTSPTVGVAAALVACTLAIRMRRTRDARRRDDVVRALLAGMEVAVADLRAGAHPEAACLAAATESTGDAAEAFRSAAATARLGGSAAQGLLAGAGRDASGDGKSCITTDLGRIAAAWEIAERHGIALAELLDAARADLVGRARFRSRVDAGMAGARATAAVLACLPVLGIGLGQMMGAQPVHILTSGGIGGILLVVGTALACAGLEWSDRITRRVTA